MSFGFNPPPKPEDKGKTFNDYSKPNSEACIIDEWCNAKRAYDTAKERLDAKKKLLIEHLGSEFHLGTSHLNTINFSLTARVSEKYEVITDDLQGLNLTLGEIANICGYDVANSLITWKPSLNKKVYDSLPDDERNKLSKFISMSYSTPTFTIQKG